MRNRCPKCKSLPHTLGVSGMRWFVRCHTCDCITPLMEDVLDAEKAWDVGLVLPKKEKKNCPWCDGLSAVHGDEISEYHVACDDCWMQGPTQVTEEEATKAWNQLGKKET